MRLSIPINADLGEGLTTDAQLMPFLTTCNIACGGHAGDLHTMKSTAALAKSFGVEVGAHPSFPDRENFGRKIINMSPKELTKVILDQINALNEICEQLSIELNHIKPHGALYNLAAKDELTAMAVLEAAHKLSKKVAIYTLPKSKLSLLAQDNFEIVHEAFLDRAYMYDGSLMPRSQKGAVLENELAIWEQCKSLFFEKKVMASDKKYIAISAQTFCVHGDTPNIYNALKFVEQQLKQHSI